MRLLRRALPIGALSLACAAAAQLPVHLAGPETPPAAAGAAGMGAESDPEAPSIAAASAPAAAAAGPAAQAQRPQEAPVAEPAAVQDPEAPVVSGSADPAAFAAARGRFLALARASYLDKTGAAPLPSADGLDAFAAAFTEEVSGLRSLAAQAAYVQSGRGPEDQPTFADMIVSVALRLSVEPPESALPIYAGRLRPKDQALTPQQSQGFSELVSAVRSAGFHRRYLYVADIFGTPVPARGPQRAAAPKRRKHGRSRPHVAPPPEPTGPAQSVLDSVDWKRADELAAAAAEGADGWNRRTRRRRRGRCYEWVRMALQKTGLWTDEYRAEVTAKGDWRRPRRAYSFAWGMNAIEMKQKDPFAASRAPLRRLDLRVDPLLKGSIVVFDRSTCGFNAKSGHIEVITSIEPLRASSYKFHDVKLECLAKAANAGQVHVYIPQRLDLYPPAGLASAQAVGPGQAGPRQTSAPNN